MKASTHRGNDNRKGLNGDRVTYTKLKPVIRTFVKYETTSQPSRVREDKVPLLAPTHGAND